MVKIYLANVGLNRSDEKRRMISPLLSDGTFEFIPIKESSKHISTNILTYKQIKAFNSDKTLAEYLPTKVQNYYAHNDPEFVNFTYGDLTKKGKSSNLLNVKKNDYLFFLARLTPYINNEFKKTKGGFYIIGYLFVEGLYRTENEIKENINKIKYNAHYLRFINKTEKIGDFFIIKGNASKSKRFIKPIEVNRQFCNKYFLDAQGNPISWNGKFKTDNQIIGSYTRTIRAILNSEKYPNKTMQFLNFIKNR